MVCQNLPCGGPRADVTKEPGKAEEAGPRSLSPAAHRRRLQLHEAFFWSPLGGHQTAPGEEQGDGSVSCPPDETYGIQPPGPPRPAPLTGAPRAPRPAAARAPGGTNANARPGPPSRRGGSPWGHASAGAASGTGNVRRRAPGHWGRKGRGVSAAQSGPLGPG